MILRQLYKLGYLLSAALFISLCACADKEAYGEGTEEGDGTVVLQLFTDQNDYDIPVTRVGVADENTVLGTPFVFVYSGTDDNATIVEIAQAYMYNGKSYVRLTKRTGNFRLFILANPPAKCKYWGYTESLTLTALKSRYLNGAADYKTIKGMARALLTDALVPTDAGGHATGSTTVTSVPYTGGGGETIPMYCVYNVTNINNNTTLGTPQSKLLLKRIVAKIIVENTAADFVLQGATVVKAPSGGKMYYSPLSQNDAPLFTVDYLANSANDAGKITGIAPAAVSGAKQTTASAPIYIYPPKYKTAVNPMVIIVRGTYKGTDYFYKLGLQDFQGTKILVEPNHAYTFTITEVKRMGFDTLAEAIASPWNSNDVMLTSYASTNMSAMDIIDNGTCSLGVTNSVVQIVSNREIPALLATTLYTDSPGTISRYVAVSGTGLQLVSPTPSSGKGLITSATTPIQVKLASNFTSGTIRIVIGDMEKIIPVTRISPTASGNSRVIVKSGEIIKLPRVGTTDPKYVRAISDGVTWIAFSLDGVNRSDLPTSIYTGDYSAQGGFYMHVRANGTTSVRSGAVYLSGINNTAGRIKLYIEQSGT